MKHYKFLDLREVNGPLMDELAATAARIVREGRYIGGKEVEAFERELAADTGAQYAIGVSNGLDALRLIFRGYMELGRLKPGDEVIVPSNTYIASILAVTDCGLTPVFVEPSLDTLNLDPAKIHAAITPRTRAILPVHLYGRAVVLPAELKERYIIVEDNAQAIGARVDGIRTGALGHAAAFSFYPTKNIGALGDAGAMTTDDPELAAAIAALRNYGTDRRYHNVYAGLNCRLDTLQAALLRVKLPGLDAEGARRREIARIYNKEITNPLLRKPAEPNSPREHVWHQYCLLAERRDEFREYMLRHGVETDVLYPTPPHRQPCYAPLYGNLSLPLADQIAAQVVSLPISSDAAEIAAIANNFS